MSSAPLSEQVLQLAPTPRELTLTQVSCRPPSQELEFHPAFLVTHTRAQDEITPVGCLPPRRASWPLGAASRPPGGLQHKGCWGQDSSGVLRVRPSHLLGARAPHQGSSGSWLCVSHLLHSFSCYLKVRNSVCPSTWPGLLGDWCCRQEQVIGSRNRDVQGRVCFGWFLFKQGWGRGSRSRPMELHPLEPD